MAHSKLYVRDNLLQDTLKALDDFLILKSNGKTLSNTVTYKFTFEVDHSAASPRDRGEWRVVVRIDFATPRKDPDGHGGTPHAQISTCLGQVVKDAKGKDYTNTQNFKAKEDTHLLTDHDIMNAINTGTLSLSVLNWLADRLLTKQPFQSVNLPGDLHFRGHERAGG